MIARGCLNPTCPRLAGKTGYCGPCSVPILAERQRVRRIYSSPQHLTWRALILKRDPVCVECKVAPSVVADHKKALRAGGDWSLSNGQGLCRHCNAVKTAKFDGALSHA